MPTPAAICHSNLIPRFLLSAGVRRKPSICSRSFFVILRFWSGNRRCLLLDRTRRSAHRVATAEMGRVATVRRRTLNLPLPERRLS
jgi:hypothetical protein